MSVSTVITDAGFDLLRAAPGHQLIYTRAVCASGHVEKTQLAALTEVVDYVMDLSIMEVKPTKTAATLCIQLDNSRAPREFQLYQLGIHAKLMDGDTEVMGDTLLQVMQYDKPDIVRAVPHISEFVVNTLIGQADKVEGIIDLAAYVSLRQYQLLADRMDASEEVVRIDHNLGGYPLVLAGALQHGIGVGGLGEGPLGGTDVTQYTVRAVYHSSQSLTILAGNAVARLGSSPQLHRVNDREYTVTWPDNQMDSMYIRLI